MGEIWGNNMACAFPETSIASKIMVSNRNFLFQGSVFRGYFSFKEGTPSKFNKEPESHPLEKEKHVPSTSIFGFNMFVFEGVHM